LEGIAYYENLFEVSKYFQSSKKNIFEKLQLYKEKILMIEIPAAE
jgi:hypothetical protein